MRKVRMTAVAVLLGAVTVAPGAAQKAVPSRYENGIASANASWLLVECRSDNPLRVARCDGFIQAIAAMIAQREFHSTNRTVCIPRDDAIALRNSVLTMKASRTPAAQAVATHLNQAFRCKPAP